MLRPDKWGAGLGVGAGLGRQSLLFLIPHLCLPHKLSRALPQRPSQSPPQQAFMAPQFFLEPTPSSAACQRARPGLSFPSPGHCGPGLGGVPAVITLLDRVIKPGSGRHQPNSPSYTFIHAHAHSAKEPQQCSSPCSRGVCTMAHGRVHELWNGTF